jgi:hypothetical protein
MSQATVGTNVHKSFDVHCQFAAQIAFNSILLLDGLTQPRNLVLSQILYARIRVNSCRLYNFFRRGQPNTIDIGQSDFDPFVIRDVSPCYTRHALAPFPLSLTLFVTGIFTDDPYNASSA